MTALIHPLKYQPDSTRLFSRLRHHPWAMLLDSGKAASEHGRYDIMVAAPFVTMTTQEHVDGNSGDVHMVTKIIKEGEATISVDDPFLILNEWLAPYQCAQSQYPFSGGAVGYFSYDLARQIERIPSHAPKNERLPHMMVGIYDWAVVVDHVKKSACLVSNGFQKATRDGWLDLCALFDAELDADECAHEAALAKNQFSVTSPVTSNMTQPAYAQAFEKIKAFIQAGDCYQVNLAQRFSARARGDAWFFYQKLREVSPAPFMAYLNFGYFQVLSGSPERFLRVVGDRVETMPIKGTRPRDNDALQDAKNARELQASIKDRAENLMIVDLLRNDIGKNCAMGSVKVDKLFFLQSFTQVHHLVSLITARLKKDKTALDILRGCFPGGSITGAPKLRAMHIIEELEPHRRGVYCGAIAYIGFDGCMDASISIRTAVYIKDDCVEGGCEQGHNEEGEMSFYAGGGIVADSVLEKEFVETLDKASGLMKTLNFFSVNK